ncbi:MAG: hypothetical protein Q4D36_03580 [Bacteroidales bacterium]|nr:hypothetical protein [Bacteroidales bacterium]
MDYKYIEQLLERYWNCETSLEEEQILHAFFRQKDIPAHLLRYKSLFASYEAAKEVKLGEDFDARILARVERPVVKAERLTMRTRFMPLFKAAAVVAILLGMGSVVQRTMDDGANGDVMLVCGECRDSISNAQVACDIVLSADSVAKKVAVDETSSGTTN